MERLPFVGALRAAMPLCHWQAARVFAGDTHVEGKIVSLFEPTTLPGRQNGRARNRKFADSLLEGDGFEPSVPRRPWQPPGAAARPPAFDAGGGQKSPFTHPAAT